MKWMVVFVMLLMARMVAGQPIKDFTLVNVADGGGVSLSHFPGPVVIVFTSNDCPFDKYYLNRIRRLADAYSGKFQFLLINSHLDPAESVELMATKFKSWGLNLPYLADKDQLAMDALGCKKCPEAFLLQKTGDQFTIVYRGLIDDNAQVESDVKEQFLKESMENLLAGRKTAVAERRAIGCSIRKK